MSILSRRQFITCGLPSAVAAVGLSRSISVQGIEPFARRGQGRLSLSLAAYSFRQYFRDGRGKDAPPAEPSRSLDMFQFVDFCADHGCDGAELTSYYFPTDVAREYLLRLKRHAFLRGVAVSGTAVGNTFTLPVGSKRDEQLALVKRWIDHAATLGAPHIRIFAGDVPAGVSPAQARMLCLSAIEESCAYAAGQGVFLGLENHGGIVAGAAELLDIVRAARSPWFGVNLDTGNFHSDDPYADVARCAPYAVNVQVKVEIQPRGKPKGPADLARLIRILREAGYQGYVALEYEADEDPWTAVPKYLQQLKPLLQA